MSQDCAEEMSIEDNNLDKKPLLINILEEFNEEDNFINYSGLDSKNGKYYDITKNVLSVGADEYKCKSGSTYIGR